MIRTRFIGSPRPREAGFSATHKQDFIAHVTGGDWIHLASQINTNDGFGNVQAELDEIQASIAFLPETLVNPFISSTPNAVAMFADSGGRVVTESFPFPLTIDPTFGDIIFPAGAGFNAMFVAATSSPLQGQPLEILGQNNDQGQGGDLILGSGFNLLSNLYDGNILLLTSRLAFDVTMPNPVISQQDSPTTTTDLFIISQSSLTTDPPGNLWLQSGTNTAGGGGNINLFTFPGDVNIIALNVTFDPTITPNILQTAAASGDASPFFITAQSTPSGIGGTLWLNSGSGSLGNMGDVNLNANVNGKINVFSSLIQFDANQPSPVITEAQCDLLVGNSFSIIAQWNASGTPGDLWLLSGYSLGLTTSGVVNIGNQVNFTALNPTVIDIWANNISFESVYESPAIYQKDGDLAVANDLKIAAQSIPLGAVHSTGTPGDLILESGYNPNNNVAGAVTLYAYPGRVNLLGSIVFIPDGGPVDNPVGGIYLYSSGGALFWRDPGGTDHTL